MVTKGDSTKRRPARIGPGRTGEIMRSLLYIQMIESIWAAMIVGDEEMPPEPGQLKGPDCFGTTAEDRLLRRGTEEPDTLKGPGSKLQGILLPWFLEQVYLPDRTQARMAESSVSEGPSLLR